MKDILLSIIVPVYNVEKWLPRCLDSILGQSYKNIEVICVNDASPDGCDKILNDYVNKDNRIKVVTHEKNRGLFRARITGMTVADGKYIAFVDSDDYVSCDWFRPLVEKAEAERAEMVVGNTVNVDEHGTCTYYNYYRSFTRNREKLSAPDLMRAFFEQAGECFVWHTVWNKLYSSALIKRALPYFETMPEPLIMGEDIAFSSVFYSLANGLAFCDNDCYFYFRHSEASTSITLPKAKIIKNLEDIITVFVFVKDFLIAINKYDELQAEFEKFKDKYHIIWSGNVTAANVQYDRHVRKLFAVGFGKSILKMPGNEEFYFYEASSKWDDGLENLKRSILYSECKYVSFDVFDTLIIRPLWEPSDIFKFAFAELPAYYVTIRRQAENTCREIEKLACKSKEDITLSDIYNYMGEEFGISADMLKFMKDREISAEYKLCTVRRTGRELFELAIAAGKRIVLTSDMYLEEDVLRNILIQNGYNGYERIFLSSSYGKLKATGSLFKVVLKELDIASNEILHIGDNRHNDVEMPAGLDIEAQYFPNAIDVFCNRIKDIYTGDAFKDIYCGTNSLFDSREFIKQMPLRCATAIVANKMFDNPFRGFNHKSMYNADPYYIGYMAEGMHVFGVAKWIYDKALECGYDKIIFLARDGFLIKKAFDYISAAMVGKTNKLIKSSYFYATRRSLFPFIIKTADDLFKLVDMTDYRSQTPADILDWFADCCRELNQKIIREYSDAGIMLNKKFSSENDFVRFLSKMSDISLDIDKNKTHRNEVSAAFKKEFSGACATFDIGYSGRLQGIICDLVGKPVDIFFIHDNGDRTSRIAAEYNYKKYCFYDFSPCISGIVREIFLSELTPSCVGYTVEKGNLKFNFDKKHPLNYGEKYAIEEVERGALDFCKNMTDSFADRLCGFTFRSCDVSVAFENFFYNATEFDFSAFRNTWIEDKLFGGYDKRSLYETLMWYSNNRPDKATVYINVPFVAKSRIGRILFYLIYDRKTFFRKLKEKLRLKRGND